VSLHAPGIPIHSGHVFRAICNKHGIDYASTDYSFDSENDAMQWMIENQFSRRNLPPFVRVELALKLKPIIAAKAKANQISAGGANPLPQNSAEAVDTRKEIAQKAGVSHDTVNKAENVIEKASKEWRPGGHRLGYRYGWVTKISAV
jgi:hypothetical protein